MNSLISWGDVFRKAESLSEPDLAALSQQSAPDLTAQPLQTGHMLREQGNLAEAIEQYQQAVLLNPTARLINTWLKR